MRNVVLLTFDSLRADHCSFMGYQRETTPALDSLSGDGVTFENAIAPASRTNPSMAGAMTGHPLVVRDRVANPEHSRYHLKRHSTVAQRLSDIGYSTAAFNPNAYASRYYGFDRGFDHFEDFLFSTPSYRSLFDRHLTDSSLYTTVRNLRNYVRRQEAFKTWDSYIDEIVDWVAAAPEPFFLWAFSLDTHFPYLTPRSYRRWSGLLDMYYYNWRCNRLIDELDIELSTRTRRKIIDVYDDAIRFADAFTRELVSRLGDDDPVVIVHGDHGEAFAEHGTYGHFYPALYEENVHVPLVVANSGKSRSVSEPVSLLELPEIVLRAAGIHDGEVAETARPWVFASDYDGRERRNLTTVRTEATKYVVTTGLHAGSRHELFDLSQDSGEEQNLVEQETSVGDTLRSLVERRNRHESEIIHLRRAVNGIDSALPDRRIRLTGS